MNLNYEYNFKLPKDYKSSGGGEMLNQENKINKHLPIYLFVFLFIISCNNYEINKEKIIIKTQEVFNSATQLIIYNQLKDSVNTWVANKLLNYKAETTYEYYIDSLICFNKNGTRFIGCRHLYVNIPDATSDDVQYIYGEKINNQWFFLKGPSIVIPRSMVKNHLVNQPLNYEQLHQIALKEVYGGYLTKDGEINEDWFISHFEGAGWVNWDDTPEKIKSYTRKDYEQFHLKVIRNNWYGVKKDSLKQLQKKDETLP